LPYSKIRPLKGQKKRTDYVGQEWDYPGDKECARGTFKVVKEGGGKRTNMYLCTRTSGGLKTSKEKDRWFNIHYVIERIDKK